LREPVKLIRIYGCKGEGGLALLWLSKSNVKRFLSQSTRSTRRKAGWKVKSFSHRVRRAHGEKRIGKSKCFFSRGFGADLVKTRKNAVFVFRPICVYLRKSAAEIFKL